MPKGVYRRSSKLLKHLASLRAIRFWEKVDKSGGSTACWPWTGCVNEWGYGQTYLEGKPCLAHRKAWVLAKGKIPSRLQVCHTCDNPPCCNPAHFFLGTQLANMADMSTKGRSRYHKISRAVAVKAINAIEDGARPGAVCKELGVNRSAIYHWMQKLKRQVGPRRKPHYFTDQFGTRYRTQAEAASKLGLSPNSVGDNLAGKYKQTRGGHVFHYVEDA